MPMDALRLLGVQGGRVGAPQGVDSRCNRLQVRGIYTQDVPAQVVNLELVRNGSDVVLVRPAVCVDLSAALVWSELENPIDASGASDPNEASAFGESNLLGEPVERWTRSGHLDHQVRVIGDALSGREPFDCSLVALNH